MRPAPEFASRSKVQPVRILLLEDDEPFAELVRVKFAQVAWGDLRVEWAATLADAKATLAGGAFDLVMTDLNLPDSKGLDTIDGLASVSDRLIIVLTGDNDGSLREAAIAHGAYDLLDKNRLDHAELERLVRLGAMQANTFRSLRESEARLKAIVNAEPECVKLLDADGNLVDMNPAGLRMIEADDVESVRGQCVFGLVAPEHREAFGDLTRRVAEGEKATLEFEIVGLKGTRRWLETNAVPLREEGSGRKLVLGITRDVTERRLAQDALRKSEAQKGAILDAAMDAIVSVDKAGLIVEFNHAAEKHFGYLREQVIGKDMAGLLVPPELREAHRAGFARLVAHGRGPMGQRIEVPALRSDGTRFDAEISLACIPDSDPPVFTGTFRDIGARKKSERALRESEARFRRLTDLYTDWYWEQDAELRFTRFDGRMAEITGNRPAEAIGLKRWELLPSITPLSCTWEEHRAVLAARLPFRDFEYSRPQENGRILYTNVSGEPMYDDAGQFCGYRGISTDITARKREERLLRLEHDVARVLADAATIGQGLQASLATICLSEGYQCGRMFCVDEPGEWMQMIEGWCDDSEGIRAFMEGSGGPPRKRGEGLVGIAWETQAPLWIPDVTVDSRVKYAALVKAAGLHALAVYPVIFDGRVLGAFALSSREVREPESRELECMAMIGSQIGQFIQRKRAEEEQRGSRQLLDNIVENIPTAVQLKSVHDGCRIVMWNKAAEAMYGIPRSEAIGLTVHDLWPKAAADAMHRADMNLVQTGGIDDFPDRLALTRDRGEIRVHMRKVTLQDASGKTAHLLVVADDITERQREERLLGLEHSVSRILAEADDPAEAIRQVIQAICEAAGWDGGRYFALDEAAGEMRFQNSWSNGSGLMDRFFAGSGRVSYTKGTGLIGLAWETGDLQWTSDAANDPRVRHAALSKDLGLRASFAFPVHFEGKVCGVLSISSEKSQEGDGRFLKALAVIGSQMGQFLTRKHAEQALLEGEARFRQTFEIAATGIAHVSLDGIYLRVNRKLCEILGYREEALVGRSVKELSHPEDRDVMDASLGRMRRGEVRSVRGDKRYIHQDGSVVWVELTVALARDAAGAPLYEISVVEDVTERKAAEDALRRFRAALDGSADMVLLASLADMQLIDFNGTACSYLGYERQELLGMKPAGYLDGVEESDLRSSFQGILAHPGRADSVVRTFRRKDGRTFSAEVLRRVIESPDGAILVLNARDLTERNLAQERHALYVRYQEKIARFGESALGRREATELIEDAVQTVFEALPGSIIAYLEPAEAQRTLTLRSLAGALRQDAVPSGTYAANSPLTLALEHGELAMSDGESAVLPFEWAQAMRSTAFAPVHGDHKVQGVLCAASVAEYAFGPEESKFLVTVASVLSAGLRRIESEGRLAFLAQFDPLTGLPNRALLSDRFSQMIVQARRHTTPLGVLFIDLDDFKLVNDTLGHAGGDDLLKEVGRRLQAAVRPGDTVARISGDEFAVILGDLAQADDAALVAQKIIDRLGAAVSVRGQEVFVTASIGIAAFPADGDDAETLLGAADAAMYRAKQSGRDSFQFFTADINQRSRARAQLGTELRRALERGEFMLAYQPKFDLRSGLPCAAEALLRWNHPERGVVSPAEFIPVLEETGLIVAAGEWVLRRACMDIKAWQAAGLRPVPVAVNLSARQFRQQDLDARIRSIVEDVGVAPELIDLEITESQLMHDPEHAQRMMRSLSDIGIRVAIDDFGTGYSSLSYLTRFPVSALKIDRSFVADVLQDRADAAIVRTIIDMAHTLGFIVIAEGVENEGQAALLRSLGCEQAQGFYFARPMPAAELMAVISASLEGRHEEKRGIFIA